MPQDTRRTGTLAAQDDTVVLNHPAISTCVIQITGTFVGTVVFEADADEGSSPNYIAVKALNVNSGSLVASVTAPALLKADVAGYRSFRVRCSAYTSGSIAITLNATEAACAPGLISAAAAGAGAATIADGANVVEGSTTDVAVNGDNAGTISAKLRGLNKLFSDVWDSVNHWLQVKVMAALPTGANVIGGVTGSGTFTVAGGKTNNNAVPGATNVGALPAIANAAAPTWTEGNLVAQSVDLAGNQRVIGDVGGFSAFPGITLTRGANVTAYTAQDEVATTSTAPTSITVSRVTGQTGFISGARLVYSNNPAVTPSFRLLLFNATLTAAGDNAALALSDADAAKYLGHIDFTATQAGGSATSDNLMMSGAPAAPIQFVTDTVFALLITTNAFTPIANSETIKIMLGTEQN